MHLTPDQTRKLRDRDSLDPAARRDNEFAVRNRLKEFLEFVPDANLILDTLPGDQLQKSKKLADVLIAETIVGLLELVGKLTKLQNGSLETMRDIAIASMKVTEDLIKQTEPAEYGCVDEGHRGTSPRITTRHFSVKLSDSLPGLSDSVAGVVVTYEPSDEEVKYIQEVRGHHHQIRRMMEEANRDPNKYEPEEFNKNILPKLKLLKNYHAATVFVGTPVHEVTQEESIKQIDIGEKMVFGEEPK